MADDKKRNINITMSAELVEWYQNMADRMGIPRSTCMVIALMSYKDQQDMLNLTRALGDETSKKQQG